MFPSSIGREIEISDIERMKFKKVNALHCDDFECSAKSSKCLKELKHKSQENL